VHSTAKKKLSFILSIFVLIMSVLPAASAAAFADTEGHWAQSASEKWRNYGVVSGHDGAFRPDDAVTRAEFAAMIDNLMKYVQHGEMSFSDVAPSQWFAEAIGKAHAAGVLQGEGGQAFPDREMSRQEAAVMIARAFQIAETGGSVTFRDEAEIADWAKPAIVALSERGAIDGFPDGTFRPDGTLTRAEAVTILNKLVSALISRPGEYSQNVEGTLVVNASDVVLNDMKIAGDLYIAEGVGEGEVTLNNVEIAGSVFVRGGGENSVIFNSVDVKGALVVNKYNGKLRVLATGSTKVSVTKMESGGLLMTRELTGGGFETIEIPADVIAGQEIVLDGTFNKVVNHSSANSLTANGTIRELVATVPTTIQGDALIEKVTSDNGSTVTVNDRPVTATPSAPAAPAPTPGGSGGSGGGSSRVSVTGVSIDQADLTLVAGESAQLTATVSPSRASNKRVSWSVRDGGSDVVAVSSTGLVTAIGAGTETVVVTTEDGAFTDDIDVTVRAEAITLALSAYEGAAVATDEQAIVANSAKLDVAAVAETLDAVTGATIPDTSFEGYAIAADALTPNEASRADAYVIVELRDRDGNVIADTYGFEATVTSDAYAYAPTFGARLAEGYQAGSFVVGIDISDSETVHSYRIDVTHPDYDDRTMLLTYVPAGIAVVSGIDGISGTASIGSELTAGTIRYEGTPANGDVAYQWYRADREDGPYAPIAGATSASYALTEEDGGKYVRVLAAADPSEVVGYAFSAPVGPVAEPAGVEDVFLAIEAAMLGDNADLYNIVADLELIASLPEFPGVTISWSTSDEAVVSANGAVTRSDADDQFVSLTATLGGAATGAKTFELIVRANGTDHVEIGEVDAYFADGYPQAYVKDGTIWVRYQLKRPAELFMVVNSFNGHIESSVKSVLEGHAGDDDWVVYVNDWPYFPAHESQTTEVQEFDTGAELDRGEARIEFVVQDTANDYVSEAVTTILFEKETVSALDEYGPYMIDAFLNGALDSIYAYFNEPLDLESVPAASDFALNHGTVTGVELYNYPDDGGMAAAYVKLSVEGVTAEHRGALELTYEGDALQDASDARNDADPIHGREVISVEEAIERVTISSDRKSMIVEIVPGWNPKDNASLSDEETLFSVAVEGHGAYSPDSARYSYSSDRLWYTLQFETPLPTGALTVTFETAELQNWAFDDYPSELTSQDIQEIPAPGVPTASYEDGDLTLTFAEGFEFDGGSIIAAGLVIEADDVEYALRGFIVRVDYGTGSHAVVIDLNDPYSARFKAAVDAAETVRIKYARTNGDDHQQLSDSAGALVPDFEYVNVTKS